MRPFWLLAGTAELPDLVAGHVAMGLALVEIGRAHV